jgi:CBS-domain-containing membrane protein
MLSLHARQKHSFKGEDPDDGKSTLFQKSRLCVWMKEYFCKWKGTGSKPAPSCNWTCFWWTFGGVAANLLLISGLNQLVIRASDVYFLLIGSLGALNTLMFAVPNAPLVQPRNIIGGHMVACAIAVLWMYFSSPLFLGLIPQWVVCALAPATAIAVMGKLGITHPPAGAACLIYVSAPFQSRVATLGWMYLILPILASAAITLVMGMAWNNLSKHRQYPIYW